MEAFRQSFRLAWPLILSNLSVPLLGMVDMGVVGHLPDPAHLGAVALGATVMSVLYFAFGFLRMGTTALTAQAFGAGDTVDAQTALLRGFMVAAGLGILVLLLGWPVILARPNACSRRHRLSPRNSGSISRSASSARRPPSRASSCWAGSSACRARAGR